MSYDYTGISYPTSLEDVNIFAIRNKLSSSIYTINETNDGVPGQLGNIKTITYN